MVKDKLTIFDRLFRDDKNQLTITQPPNLPIIIWFVSTLCSRLIAGEQRLLDYIGFGALFTWAWLEIFQGQSFFRRGLGILVMSVLLISKM